jgi:hypothetical protein
MASSFRPEWDGMIESMVVCEEAPLFHRSGRAMMNLKLAVILVALLALAISPVVVSLSHAQQVPTDISQLLEHGHSHGDELEVLFPGHDATDHEHQLNALFPAEVAETLISGDETQATDRPEWTGHLRTRLLKPPRTV